MGKRRNGSTAAAKAVKGSTADAVAFNNVESLGYQMALAGLRGQARGVAALAVWPALRKDFALADDGWDDFDVGCRKAFDATYPALALVRTDDGAFRLAAGDETPTESVTAMGLLAYDRAAWLELKSQQPTRWAPMKALRERFEDFKAGAKRTLRLCVNMALKAEAVAAAAAPEGEAKAEAGTPRKARDVVTAGLDWAKKYAGRVTRSAERAKISAGDATRIRAKLDALTAELRAIEREHLAAPVAEEADAE